MDRFLGSSFLCGVALGKKNKLPQYWGSLFFCPKATPQRKLLPKAYGIKSIPCFILIAPNGRIEKYRKGYAMHHSGMEKEIMEIILPNSSPTETSK